jgi:hypothetical protein
MIFTDRTSDLLFRIINTRNEFPLKENKDILFVCITKIVDMLSTPTRKGYKNMGMETTLRTYIPINWKILKKWTNF